MTSREFRHSIEIAAAIDEVWAVLARFEAWSEWAGAETTGELAPGEVVTIRWDPPSSPMSYRARTRVIAVDPPRRIHFGGKSFSHRLLSGERIFTLDAIARERTRLTNEGRYTGAVKPLVSKLAGEAESFALQFNQRLKRRVEERG